MGIIQSLLWIFGGRRMQERMLNDGLHAWRIVKMTNQEEGKTCLVRIRITKPPLAEKRSLPLAVLIEWPYDSDTEFPPGEVLEQMDRFERAIDPLCGDNGFSEHMWVRTGFGTRDWLFYTTSQERFLKTFNRVLVGHEPYPIQIVCSEDPAWEIWHDTMSTLGDSIEQTPAHTITLD
jgi:hypothetical protein